MSFTSNTATRDMPWTYTQRASECETLLSIAREMESMTRQSEWSWENDAFQALERQFQSKLLDIGSLR